MKPFSLLVKPVGGACNLNCSYCFYRKDHPAGLMTAETAGRLFSAYDRLPFAEKSVTLQGGEPLLAWDTPVFHELAERPSIAKSIQTNATLITDNIAAAFKRGNWLVGVSLDGPEPLNRLRGNSFDATTRGIRALEKAGVDYNFLTVVSRANVAHAREVYTYLRDNFSTRFHQYIDCTGPCDEITGEEWGRFLVELFDEWIKADSRTLSIRLFDSIVSKLVLGQVTQCSFAPTCRQYLTIDWDGSVYPCDFYVKPELRLGNIHENSFDEILASPIYDSFTKAKLANLPAMCRSCDHLEFCFGDCPRSKGRMCAGLKAFFAHALPDLRRLADEVSRA